MNKIVKARTTILEMLQDRGYDTSTVEKTIIEDSLNFCCKKQNDCVYIYFIKMNFKNSDIKNIISNHNETDKLIFIFAQKPNVNIIKYINSFQNDNYETFYLDLLQINITKHKLVPKHEILNDDEIENLLDKYKLSCRYKLPTISKDDPIVKYYNFKKNSICKITRNNPNCSNDIFYRCVR